MLSRGVGAGNFAKVGVGVGHFTSDSATLVINEDQQNLHLSKIPLILISTIDAYLYNRPTCPLHCQWPTEIACKWQKQGLHAAVNTAIVVSAFYTLHYGSMLFDYFKIMGISSDKKFILKLLCCKTRIGVYCGLADW